MFSAIDVLAAAMHTALDQERRNASEEDAQPVFWNDLPVEQKEPLRKASAFLVSYVGTTPARSTNINKATAAVLKATGSVEPLVTTDAVIAALQLLPTVNADAR